MKKSDPVIRAGDEVRVIDPRFVLRVGYPKSVDDYLTTVREKHAGLLDALFHHVVGDTHRTSYSLDEPRVSKQRGRVERELAYLLAREDHFGGYERSIHWMRVDQLKGKVLTVHSVRSVYTGHYYPPSGDAYDGYEPGGLDKPKCHRLARVSLLHLYSPPVFWPSDRKCPLEIPVYHLSKVNDG